MEDNVQELIVKEIEERLRILIWLLVIWSSPIALAYLMRILTK